MAAGFFAEGAVVPADLAPVTLVEGFAESAVADEGFEPAALPGRFDGALASGVPAVVLGRAVAGALPAAAPVVDFGLVGLLAGALLAAPGALLVAAGALLAAGAFPVAFDAGGAGLVVLVFGRAGAFDADGVATGAGAES